MNIKSTYDLIHITLGYFGFSKTEESNQNNNTIHMNQTETKFIEQSSLKEADIKTVDNPISADKPYRVSSTPYKDALMKGIVKYKFKNRDYRYYQKLGNKINKIVDEHTKARSHRYWWVEDYLTESYIINNGYLKRNDYCVVLSRKILNKYKKQN
jgi:hypothetical protein